MCPRAQQLVMVPGKQLAGTNGWTECSAGTEEGCPSWRGRRLGLGLQTCQPYGCVLRETHQLRSDPYCPVPLTQSQDHGVQPGRACGLHGRGKKGALRGQSSGWGRGGQWRAKAAAVYVLLVPQKRGLTVAQVCVLCRVVV